MMWSSYLHDKAPLDPGSEGHGVSEATLVDGDGSSAVPDVLVLPPVADDPVFGEQAPGAAPDASRRLGADPHDFAGLFIKHKWSFQLHARRFLSDRRDIEEVVQEGFLKLFLALPELETELQALAYARRTITNLCIDRYRAEQRRPRLIDLETLSVEPAADEDELDPIIQAENAAIVREALALLSPLHRQALIKREIEEKPLPQIAEELDIPVEQVKHVLHRARRSLRRLLVGTHVEPGVDLDLALVLAANRARAARAAKPVGASVIALLVLIAGVLGLRPDRPAPHTTDIALPTAPEIGLGLPEDPRPAPAALPQAPALTHQVPVSPRRPRTHRRTGVKQVVGGGSTTPVPGKGPVVTPGSPVVTPPRPVAPSTRKYNGNLRTAGPVHVSSPSVASTSDGQQALSTAIVPISGGSLVLDQQVTNGANGAEATLKPRIEQDDQSVTIVPKQTTTSVSRSADGSLVVDIELTARSQAVVTSDSGPDQSVGWFKTVITYAPDLSSITSEVITTQEGEGPEPTPPTEPSNGPIRSSSAVPSDRQSFPTSKEAEGTP
ncbi:MAG: polymerase subunit sigma-24 [Frankiales bacterium]|nr:polymerase subunit sigma-24 [Frankiales bacterium]